MIGDNLLFVGREQSRWLLFRGEPKAISRPCIGRGTATIHDKLYFLRANSMLYIRVHICRQQTRSTTGVPQQWQPFLANNCFFPIKHSFVAHKS